MKYEDTYFLNAEEALKVASQQNRWGENNYYLQVCYYEGEKIDSDLPNLIHLPIENLVEGLAYGRHRIPEVLNFDGLELSSDIKLNVLVNFNLSIKQAQGYRTQLNQQYLHSIQNLKLNFDETLRVYLSASTSTRVMQYVSKNIAEAFAQKGCEVLYDLYYGTEDQSNMKRLLDFNPHVTININHLNNRVINQACFNFVWYQDAMPALTDNSPMYIRDRDYILSYHTMLEKFLHHKGVPQEKIFDFKIIPVNTNQFYLDESVEREDKVVFVGTYYQNMYPNYIDDEIDKKLKALLESGDYLSQDSLEQIFDKYLFNLPSSKRFVNDIRQSYIRNTCVSWLCENSSKKVEIYGYNWEKSNDKNIIERFKGKVDPSELNGVYNSAKYVLSASGGVINTQRLGELVHAGAIPIVYDSRGITDEDKTWDDECLYFKTKEELHYILANNIKPKKYRDKEMLDYFTYKEFLNIVFTQIEKKIGEK